MKREVEIPCTYIQEAYLANVWMDSLTALSFINKHMSSIPFMIEQIEIMM